MHKEKMILKHPLNIRIFHYTLILSFLPLAVTGVVLYFKPFADTAMNLMMQIHIAAGVLLTLGAVSISLISSGRVILFIKRIFTVSMNDVKWFLVLGGYPQKFLFKKKVAVPPMAKYNSGQKLFGIFVFIGGTILIISGLVLWAFPHNMPRGTVALLGSLHTICGFILTIFLPVHLFLGIYMSGDFKAMIIHGKIPYDEAKDMSPLWVAKEIIANGKK